LRHEGTRVAVVGVATRLRGLECARGGREIVRTGCTCHVDVAVGIDGDAKSLGAERGAVRVTTEIGEVDEGGAGRVDFRYKGRPEANTANCERHRGGEKTEERRPRHIGV